MKRGYSGWRHCTGRLTIWSGGFPCQQLRRRRTSSCANPFITRELTRRARCRWMVARLVPEAAGGDRCANNERGNSHILQIRLGTLLTTQDPPYYTSYALHRLIWSRRPNRVDDARDATGISIESAGTGSRKLICTDRDAMTVNGSLEGCALICDMPVRSGAGLEHRGRNILGG